VASVTRSRWGHIRGNTPATGAVLESRSPKALRDAGILQSEKRGLRVYYYVEDGALDELAGWLHS
jgi:hypothetical protein